MDSEYHPGKRSADWLKIKHHRSEEAIIAGFTSPRGGRKYFGALILGTMVNEKLIYAGHTGSGFNTELLKDIYAKLQPLISEKSPFDERVKTNMPVTWVEPKYVCEVKLTEWTSDGKLRHPIFLRLREDKQAKDISTQHINAGEMEKDIPVENNPVAAEEKPLKKHQRKNLLKQKQRQKLRLKKQL
jgi:bifunctional non-homologous end joining protein LigD